MAAAYRTFVCGVTEIVESVTHINMKRVHIVGEIGGGKWWIRAFGSVPALDIKQILLLRILNGPPRLGTRTSNTFTTEMPGLVVLNIT